VTFCKNNLPVWPGEIFHVLLDHNIRQVAYVPDAGHQDLIERCIDHQDMTSISLTTEQEGIALLAGAWLGGDRGVLLMQSSGVGNCINMLSLPRICQMPLLMLVTMRGEHGEFNPWQIPMGQNMEEILTATGVLTYRASDCHKVRETVDVAVRKTFEHSVATAVLISQSVLGVKTFEQ
jgi:sulfopyruvate decarboxylase alpha subunit